MGFNKDKKKKLVDLLAKRRAAAAGVCTSTPTSPPPSATFAPNTTEPTHVDDRQKGVVAIDSEDEDTCTSLFYKRQRVGETVAPSHSASGGLTATFRNNPPSASSPHHLIVHEGGGESAPEDCSAPPAPELPAPFQQALKPFQDKEMLESLSSNLLQDRVAYDLRDFLVASSLALSKAQETEELKAWMAMLDLMATTRGRVGGGGELFSNYFHKYLA